jgi:hypothetical protein
LQQFVSAKQHFPSARRNLGDSDPFVIERRLIPDDPYKVHFCEVSSRSRGKFQLSGPESVLLFDHRFTDYSTQILFGDRWTQVLDQWPSD